MNITDGIYTDFRKLEQGVKLYMKISQPIAYATLKLVQFLARSVKEKYFSQDMVENFAKFMKTTNGEFSIYRMPYVSDITRETAIENAKNYLDKAGIKYCIMDSVNDKDNALHISVARKDEQKFNVMFTDYLKEQLSGGEKNADDLVNLTDRKTTIISIPDASLDIMKNALTEVNVNFAELPDLVPDDGEKQLRIASADLNVTKQCYEAYRRSLMKNKPEEAAAEMKVFSEEDYTDGAKETTEQYMKNSVSDELKEKLQKYEKFDADEMEKELMKWDTIIKDSKGFECQALRSNMASVPISFENISGAAKGYYNPVTASIAIKAGMPESQTVKTMIHEIAHSILHNDILDEAAKKDRQTKEVEAESVAYTVCQHFGIDTSDYSFGYIAGWSSSKETEELKQSLETIQKTASGLINDIERIMPQLKKDMQLKENVTESVTENIDEPEIEYTAGMRI